MTSQRLSPSDPNSYALPEEAKVTDMALNWAVDFEKKRLTGSVVLTVKRVDPAATYLTLDAKDLDISKAVDESDGSQLEFSVGEMGYVGSKMLIKLPASKDEMMKIKVFYSTTENCTALAWMEPDQTAGKRQPFLFSQCQAIHARTMVPCQDTPAVKSTYSATVSAPSDITVVMSAVKDEGEPEPDPERPGHRLHKFVQVIPIQSYLVAIAAGDLVSKKIGPRSRVWSEKEVVDAAAYDFEDTEAFIQKAEDLCGKYVWGIYDILVLPPSFPYGGMENPCLTFATPTLLAGDKSLANVIAHEIAHSWTGNLVTNKNFEHFWLNEGFTVFVERKISGRIGQGEATRGFQAIGGWKSLKYTINDVLKPDNPLTNLVVDLDGVDPDDAFSVVPYEKGSTLLWYLEDLVGGPEVFEPFLKSYLENFKHQSIDTCQFKEYFLKFFSHPVYKDLDLSVIDWESWFHKPGMPPYKPNFDTSLAQPCIDLKNKWVQWDENTTESPFKAGDLADFTSGQKIEFLAQLLEESPLSVAKVTEMRKVYGFDAVKNSEIRFRWIRTGLAARYEPAVEMAVAMVTDQGRMKFLRPIYRDLYDWEEMRQVGIDTYHKVKHTYMQVSRQGLEKDLHISS